MSSPVKTFASEVSHVAHFYDRVGTHVDHVADYLAEALLSEAGVLIVARSATTKRLRSAIAARDIDVDRATRTGLYVELDAEVLLSQIEVGESLDLEKFQAIVRSALVDAGRGRHLRVYGELVSLLWEAGDVQGAIDIEDCWIRLADGLEFSLLCGYDASSMSSRQIDGFHDLCARHSGVAGEPPAIEGAEHGRRFPGSSAALRPARRFVADTLSAWGLDELVDDATLVIGELATNAVMHAQSDFKVALTRSAQAVRLSVSDASQAVPRSSQPAFGSVGGYGTHVVAKLASATGHDVTAGGKVIWAELACPPVNEMAV